MIYIIILVVLAALSILDYVELPTRRIAYSQSDGRYEDKKISLIKNTMFWVIIIGFIIFVGLRYYVGLDYNRYKIVFYYAGLGQRVFGVQRGYYYLNVIIRNLINNVQWVFLIMAVITLLINGYAIKKGTKKVFFALFIYYCMFLLVYDMGQIRSALAQSLVLLSIYLFVTDRKKLAIIPIILTPIMHTSALVALLIFVVLDREYSYKKIIIMYIVCIVIGQLLNLNLIGELGKGIGGHIGSQIYNYTMDKQFTQKIGLSFNVMLDFIFLFSILAFKKIYAVKDKVFNRLFQIYFIGICIYLLFNNYFVIGVRFAAYFKLSLVFLLPMIIDRIKNKKIKYICLIILIGVFSIMFLRQLDSNIGLYLPYRINLHLLTPMIGIY